MAAIPAYDLGLLTAALRTGLAADWGDVAIIEVGDAQDVARARASTAPAVILVWSDGARDDGGRVHERVGVLLALRDASALASDSAARGDKLRDLLLATRTLLDGRRPPAVDSRWEPPRWEAGALFDLGEPASLRHAWRDTYLVIWHRTLGG